MLYWKKNNLSEANPKDNKLQWKSKWQRHLSWNIKQSFESLPYCGPKKMWKRMRHDTFGLSFCDTQITGVIYLLRWSYFLFTDVGICLSTTNWQIRHRPMRKEAKRIEKAKNHTIHQEHLGDCLDRFLLCFYSVDDSIKKTWCQVTFQSFHGLWWTLACLTRSEKKVVRANTLSQFITQHLLNVINSPS